MKRAKAVKECQNLWGEIEESGLSKVAFLNTEAGKKWRDKGYSCDCPLCECARGCYDAKHPCPLYEQYGKDCGALGWSYNPPPAEWFEAVRGLKP